MRCHDDMIRDGSTRAGRARAVSVLCAALVLCASGGARGQHGDLAVREGGAPPSIQALAMTANGALYAGSFGSGMFVSRDGGETWAPSNRGLDDRFILCVSPDDRGTVYAGTVRGGVFRTRDDGDSWAPVNAGLQSLEVKSLLTRHGTTYAGTGRGVYRFDADAQRWEALPGLEHVLVSSLAVTDDRRVFAGTAGRGVYRLDVSAPGVAEWERMSDPLVDPREHLTHTYIRVMAVSPDQQVYAGTLDGGVYRSPDAGTTWRPVGRALPNDSIRGIVVTASALYAATGLGVFVKREQDDAWAPRNEGLTELSMQSLIGAPRGVLYAGTSAGVFRSRDRGRHWVNVSDTLGRVHSIPRPYF